MKKSHAISWFLFGSFSCGVLAAQFDIPPYPHLAAWLKARTVRAEQEKDVRAAMSTKNLLKKRDISTILRGARARAPSPTALEEGATLIATGASAAALVDASGTIMHRWQVPFSKIFPDTTHIVRRSPDALIHITAAHVFPGGELIAVYEAEFDSPYGYGVARLERSGKVLWRYPANAHHALEPGPEGTIYTLVQRYEPLADPSRLTHMESPALAEYIVALDEKTGEETQRIPLMEAFLDTPYEALLYTQPIDIARKKRDYLHPTSISRLDESMAAAFPQFSAGDLLVSFRNIHTLAVISPTTGKVVWASRGIWKMQSDARFLPSGDILVFDNMGFEAEGKKPRSRVLVTNPTTQATSWHFTGDESGFYTETRGRAQALPSGNYLITESLGGNRAIEVSADNKILWSLQLRARGERRVDNVLYTSQRIPFDYFSAEFCKTIRCSRPGLNSTPPKD